MNKFLTFAVIVFVCATASLCLVPGKYEMNEKQFWALIGRALVKSHSDGGDFEKSLHQEFSRMKHDDLVRFQYFLQMALEKSNTRNLLAACHIILDGCSSDSFMEFRGWLVSRGANAFHSALRNADHISNLLPDDEDHLPLLELDLFAPTFFESKGLGLQDQFMDEVEEVIAQAPFSDMPDASIDQNTNFQELAPALYKRYKSTI